MSTNNEIYAVAILTTVPCRTVVAPPVCWYVCTSESIVTVATAVLLL